MGRSPEFWQYGHLMLHPAKKTTMETFPYQSTVDMSVIPPSLVRITS
jgi:hypothetical protein